MASKAAFGFNTPFAEALEFFRQKLNLPTERWDDIKQSAHDRAFIVAGAGKADLLDDLRRAMDKARAHGMGLQEFRKDFAQIVFNRGWTGFTGDGSKAGIAWRTKVIYQTNMATSYAAGRWQQLNHPDLLKLRPYWRYHHADGALNPRPQHLAWNGLTLPHDHPFWKLHYPPQIPPNWGCKCYVTAVGAAEYAKAQAVGKAAPSGGWERVDAKHKDPALVAQGWNFAPGANANRPLKDFIDRKLIGLDAPVGAAMWDAIKPVLMAEQSAAVRNLVAVAAASMEPAGASAVAHVVAPATVAALSGRGVELNAAAIWLRDHELIHAIRDAKDARGVMLPLDVWLNLPEYLDRATPYLDTGNNTLVYAFDLPGVTGKVVVRVNYSSKVRVGGKRQIVKSNFIVTGGVVEAENLNDPRYVRIK